MAGLTSLAPLAGVWSLRRAIEHSDGSQHRFEGTARFIRSGRRMVHDEEGLLSGVSGQPPIKASRRYVWALERGRIEVLFGDMRPFHTIPLGIAHPETTYLCPPDRYQVAYDFSDIGHWHAVWRVEGPRKSYVMRSAFERGATGAAGM